jgi:hypothetical protein
MLIVREIRPNMTENILFRWYIMVIRPANLASLFRRRLDFLMKVSEKSRF